MELNVENLVRIGVGLTINSKGRLNHGSNVDKT